MEGEVQSEPNLSTELFSDQNNPTVTSRTTGPSRRQYPISLKRTVLSEVIKKQNANIPKAIPLTAKQMNVSAKVIHKWYKHRDNIFSEDVSACSLKVGCGRPLKNPEAENYIVQWAKEKLEHSLPVTAKMMAAEVIRKYPAAYNNDEFDACLSWIYSLMERNDLSTKRKSHSQTVSRIIAEIL